MTDSPVICDNLCKAAFDVIIGLFGTKKKSSFLSASIDFEGVGLCGSV